MVSYALDFTDPQTRMGQQIIMKTEKMSHTEMTYRTKTTNVGSKDSFKIVKFYVKLYGLKLSLYEIFTYVEQLIPQ